MCFRGSILAVEQLSKCGRMNLTAGFECFKMEKSKSKWNCVLLRVRQRGRVNMSRMAGVEALVHVNMEDGKSKFWRAGQRPRKKLTLQPKTRYNLETSPSLSHTSFSFRLRLSIDWLNPTHTRKGNLFDSDVYFRWWCCCSVALLLLLSHFSRVQLCATP